MIKLLKCKKISGHIEVWDNKKLLGYFKPGSGFGENWQFVSKCESIKSFHTEFKKDIILKLIKLINKPMTGKPVKMVKFDKVTITTI